MQRPLTDPRAARAAERDVRISLLVFGSSLLLMALEALLRADGDLTVRIPLLVIGIGAAIWGRSRAAGVRESAFGPATRAAFAWRRVLVVVLTLGLLISLSDRSLWVKGRALMLAVLGTLIVSTMIRPARPPVDDATGQ